MMNGAIRRLIPGVGLLLLLASASSVFAQGPTRLPVIVVFQTNVNFQPSAAQFLVDDRAVAQPEAWNYLDRGVAGAVQSLERRWGFRSDHVYSHAIRGFAARLSAAQIQALRQDPAVRYVEPDIPMEIVGKPSTSEPAEITPWGISRIGANNKGDVPAVYAYVIDTGIDGGHPDLKGLLVDSVNFAGGKNGDCNGHGTHVAGTIAALNNDIDVVGVAPGAKLVAVKVLGCNGSGTNSGVIKGVDWVTYNAVKPAVANMSLGGGASQALDDAVQGSAASGVFYAVAAGNSGADACNSSPARAGRDSGGGSGIMTVAATDSLDREASWSNFGACVDIWAPGVSIPSTKLGGGVVSYSGTSMASPHVAGTAARYLGMPGNSSMSASSVEGALTAAQITPNTHTTSKNGFPIILVNADPY